MITPWQVATAAEAFAAGQFARCGWDVSVQYGANQPEYDLIASAGELFLKVSVKGSKDGAWGLTQSYLQLANYHGAVDAWLAKHTSKTVFCLVQFFEIPLDAIPRMYLATPAEIGAWLKSARAGHGLTTLHEHKEWTVNTKAPGAAGTVDQIPAEWRFTSERLKQLAAATSQRPN
jgi:hypothetical protein